MLLLTGGLMSDYKRPQKPISSDKFLFVCPKCNRVWETFYGLDGQGKKIRQTTFYANIPRYGKEYKLCIECKGEDDATSK